MATTTPPEPAWWTVGWVFGAGTMSWSWALSKAGYVDARLQQATTNILNRFVQSTTTATPTATKTATPTP